LDRLINAGGCVVFVVLSRIVENVEMSKTATGVLTAMCVLSLLWIGVGLVRGNMATQKKIAAHMMMILKAGINPMTTPIRAKWVMCISLLAVGLFSLFHLGGFLVLIAAVGRDQGDWLSVWEVLEGVFQAVMVAATMWPFRPRGASAEQYMRTTDAEERAAVTEWESETFMPGGGRALREWAGEVLPPDPMLLPDVRRRVSGVYERVIGGQPR
jgi:hypothetical protein